MKSSNLIPSTQKNKNSKKFFTSNHYTISINIPKLKINLNYFNKIIT